MSRSWVSSAKLIGMIRDRPKEQSKFNSDLNWFVMACLVRDKLFYRRWIDNVALLSDWTNNEH